VQVTVTFVTHAVTNSSSSTTTTVANACMVF
jgi:hypothetical protein